MKKSVWIFLFAVLLPSVVLGWLALRSAEEQQIVFERRTAELYQKETEALAVTVRDTVEGERRVFGETVHRLLANGDAEALARDFTNTLADAWPVKAVGFAINREGKLVSPTVAMASKQPDLQRFLLGNGSFLTSTEPAIVYNWAGDNQVRGKSDYGRTKQLGNLAAANSYSPNPGNIAAKDGGQAAQAQIFGDKDGPVMPPTQREAQSKMNDYAALKKSDAPGKDATDPAESPAKLAPAMPLPAPAGVPHAATAAKPGEAGRKEATSAASQPTAEAAPDMAPVATGIAATRMRAVELATRASKPGAEVAMERKSATDKLAADMPAMKSLASTEVQDAKKQATGDAGQMRDAMKGAEPSPRPTVEKSKSAARRTVPPASAPMPQAPGVSQSSSAQPMDGLQSKVSGGMPLTPQEGNAQGATGGAFANPPAGALALNNAQNRQVEPQQLLGAPSAAWSTVVPESAEFRTLTEEGDDGMVARFAQDKLNLIFWLRPPEAPEMVFGCLVEAGHFSDVWKDVLERHRSSPRDNYRGSESQPEFVLALLDDRGKPVATRPASADARDWKRPFVASEIGEVLPHWEAALYLASPTALAESARGLWRTLAFTIAGAVALIAFGGWLVVADARRQLALAQQKTDFVSNVSHELKTPLTSIRMFAELMHDRPQPPEKQGQYLRIITVEAERLTRLINNVLDFAKIGRKQKRVEKKPLDLHAVVARVWESQELHLREAGFTTRWEAAPGPYPVLGDEDALSQVLVNLLSNAEKYSTGSKEVELHTWLDDGHVDIAVMDRGMGVPNGDDRKIFEAFYRAHDSLNSGIQGSGLGLTLAQRVAHEHAGEIRFERREGGGCRFTLRLPLARMQESSVRNQGSGSRAFPGS